MYFIIKLFKFEIYANVHITSLRPLEMIYNSRQNSIPKIILYLSKKDKKCTSSIYKKVFKSAYATNISLKDKNFINIVIKLTIQKRMRSMQLIKYILKYVTHKLIN